MRSITFDQETQWVLFLRRHSLQGSTKYSFLPVELGSHDRSSAAEMRQSWCESGREIVLWNRPTQTQRGRQTVQTPPLGRPSSPDSQLTSLVY